MLGSPIVNKNMLFYITFTIIIILLLFFTIYIQLIIILNIESDIRVINYSKLD